MKKRTRNIDESCCLRFKGNITSAWSGLAMSRACLLSCVGEPLKRSVMRIQCGRRVTKMKLMIRTLIILAIITAVSLFGHDDGKFGKTSATAGGISEECPT